MAKQITIETVLAAINEGEALGDIRGKIENGVIYLSDGEFGCGFIEVAKGDVFIQNMDIVTQAYCFGKAKEWILAKIA